MKIESFTTEQPIDLAEWKIYTLKNGLVALTSVGRELFRNFSASGGVGRTIMSEIAKYRKSYLENTHSLSRSYISRGSNGSVYSLGGTELVIKEGTNGISLYDTVNRMDSLKHILDNARLPSWIGIPEHYGVVEYTEEVESGSDAKQKMTVVHTFMLIQKIDSGITVESVLAPEEDPRVKKELGEVTEAEKAEIKSSLNEVLKIVTQKVEDARTQNPNLKQDEQFLPDFHAGNILIEGLSTPIDGRHFKLWIIDQ